jgi:transposase-like protein
MGFWGSYRLDENTPDPEHVLNMSSKGESGMRPIQRSRLSADASFLPSLKKGKAWISCPDCQSGRIHRSRTRGIVESLLVFLRIQPYRCDECDYRFFRWCVQNKSRTTRSPRTINV